MTLGPDNVLYFAHVPKTGGTTLWNVLSTQFEPDEVAPMKWLAGTLHSLGSLWRMLENPVLDIGPWRLLRGHHDVSIADHLSRPAVVVTMLREPVARVVSLYKHMQRVEHHALHAQVTALTLYEFVTGEITHEVSNHQTRLLAGVSSTRGSAIATEEDLAAAVAALNRCAVVGALEHYDAMIAALNAHFGWTLAAPPVLNAAPDDQQVEVDEATRAAIIDRNQCDLQLYEIALSMVREVTA